MLAAGVVGACRPLLVLVSGMLGCCAAVLCWRVVLCNWLCCVSAAGDEGCSWREQHRKPRRFCCWGPNQLLLVHRQAKRREEMCFFYTPTY